MKKLLAAFSLSLLLLPAACRQKAGSGRAATASPAQAEPRRFALKGVLKQVGGGSVTVEHEAVPGYMPAMTMAFPVRDDPHVVEILRPGDRIEATLVVARDGYWLEKILTRGFQTTAAAAPAASASGIVTPRPNRGVAPGAVVPDFELTDQTGKSVRLSQWRGEPVAITFIYTRCPIASACPMATAKFARLDAMLDEKKFGQLLSITMDPAYDTPRVLAEYAKMMGAKPKRWRFLTGAPQDVARAAESFGVMYFPDTGQITHTQAVAVVDPKGRLSMMYFTNAWEPEHVLRDMEKARQS